VFSEIGILGFLCGKCPNGPGNGSEVQGLSFTLSECVSCETGDRILFVLICKLDSWINQFVHITF